MGGRKLWKVAEEYGENSRLVIRPSGRGGKIESLMGGGKETRSKKLEEIGNALRKKRGWRRFLSFFFFFLFRRGGNRGGCASGRFRAGRISSRMEIAWEIVVRVETFTSVSRAMQALSFFSTIGRVLRWI